MCDIATTNNIFHCLSSNTDLKYFIDVIGSIGTAVAAIAALFAIRQSNKRLKIEQTPYVVLDERILTAGPADQQHLHIAQIINVGRGCALDITLSADPSGLNSIVDGSNPHSKNIQAGGHSSWALEERRIIEGLKDQGKKIKKSIVKEIPDENDLSAAKKHLSDFFIFIWYRDQLGLKYLTKCKIRHSGIFFKVMENIQVPIK